VSVAGDVVTVESGSKKLTLKAPRGVKVEVDGGAKAVKVTIDPESKDNRQARADWGSTRAHINNMLIGVTKGFEKTLEVNGVGWGATIGGKTIDLKVGYANILKIPIPAGLEVAVDKTFIRIKGADRQAVGQLAAVVRAQKKPEPYNAKGIKYSDEVIKRKQGKAFGA
jgi:large subunit ribosomal protein L6